MSEKTTKKSSKSTSSKRSRPKDEDEENQSTSSPEVVTTPDTTTEKDETTTDAQQPETQSEPKPLSKRQKKRAKAKASVYSIESHPALTYLEQWNTGNAKFQKVRQTYLLLHCYDETRLPDPYFKLFAKYIKGLQGKSRETTLFEASAILAWNEDHKDVIKQYYKQQDEKKKNKKDNSDDGDSDEQTTDDKKKDTDQMDDENNENNENKEEPVDLPPFIFNGKEVPPAWKTRIGKKRAKKIVKTLTPSE